MALKKFSVAITKRNDDEQMVFGYASTPARDYDGDIITLDAMRGALEDYMKFANIREMHEMKAVGVAKEASVDDKGLYIGAKIVDPLAWLKVKEGVYKAFSIGGNATGRDPADPHTITGLQLIEISIVDRPANPEAVIDVFKAPALKEQQMTKPMTEDEKRAELAKAIGELSGDSLTACLDAFRKQLGTQAPPEVTKAAEPAPAAQAAPASAAAPAQVPEPAPRRIARCLKAAGPGSQLAQAVAKAVNFTDAQFEGVLKLDAMAMGNWLGNNHGLLEAVEKAIPADSNLWATQKPVTFQDVPSDGDDTADVKKAAKADEVVKYADPGLQPDGQARFPLNGESPIRAAWGYINKAKNQSKYSSDQIDTVKANIIAAWKDQIDSEGPPSAVEKAPATKPKTETNVKKTNQTPDAKGDLRKGLMTACIALGLLDRLDCLQKSVAAEEAREGDGSAAPSRFMDVLKALSDVVKAYVDEEVAEMLSGESDAYDVAMPYGEYIAYGNKATDLLKSLGWDGAKIAAALEDLLGDRTGAPGYTNLEKFASTELVKIKKSAPSGESGDWNGDPSQPVQPQDWKAKAQTMHDLAKSMGASCDTQKAHDDEEDEDCEDMDKKKKSAKTEKQPAPVAKAKKAADDEEEEEDGDEEAEDADGEKDPAEPGTKKKKAASADKGAAPAVTSEMIAQAIAESPLAKAVEELTGLFKGRVTNPAKPAPVAKAVAKGEDTPADDKVKAVEKAPTPQEVLKGIHSRPNFIRN